MMGVFESTFAKPSLYVTAFKPWWPSERNSPIDIRLLIGSQYLFFSPSQRRMVLIVSEKVVIWSRFTNCLLRGACNSSARLFYALCSKCSPFKVWRRRFMIFKHRTRDQWGYVTFLIELDQNRIIRTSGLSQSVIRSKLQAHKIAQVSGLPRERGLYPPLEREKSKAVTMLIYI